MDEYYIATGMDKRLHIYKHQEDAYEDPYLVRTANCQQEYELSWQGLFLTVRPRVFWDWLSRPREIGDEFDLFGQKFLVVDQRYDSDKMVCSKADPVGYRLLLHILIWKTEMRVWGRTFWGSIPISILDEITRDSQLEEDVSELRKQFAEERYARNNAILA